MSKTVEEVGLIVGGIGLALASGPVGLIALQGNVAVMNAMIGIGLTTALTGVGLALRPNLPAVGAANTLNFTSGPSPRRVGYGRSLTPQMPPTYASFPPSQNVLTTNEYLHLVYTLTGHEISSFDAVMINGSVYNFGTDLLYDPAGAGDTLWHVYPDGNSTANDFYWQHMFFEFDFGRDWGAQPFPNLAASDPTWTSACLQHGCAKVHVLCRYDSGWTAVFPSGQIPNIQFLITGKKLLDPRVVTAWASLSGYVKYNYIVDNNGTVWVQQNSSGTSGASRPNFEANDSSGFTLGDGGLSWRSSGEGMTTISFCADSNPQGHLLNGRLVNDAWIPNFAVNQYAIIEAPLGYLQQATVAGGTTGASEPSNFSENVGGITTDNAQTWVCLGRSWNAINPSNPALVVNDYLQNSDYGFDAPAATIDASATIAAANVCEEQQLIIWNADGTKVYENQYACDGIFDFSSTRFDVLTALCGSMAGWCVPPGDLWRIFAGAYQTPTIALGDSDMRGPVKGDWRLPVDKVLNTVGASYVPAFLPTNPGGATSLTQVPGTWQSQSAPEYQANGLAGKPNYLNSEDGGQILRQKIQLDFTTSLWMAQRLEKITMMRTRFQQTFALPCKSIALQLEAGDSFSWTHVRWGIEAATFEATQCGITWEGSGGGASGGAENDVPVIGVDLIARQTDPSIYEYQGPTSAGDYGEYSPYGITGVMTGVE